MKKIVLGVIENRWMAAREMLASIASFIPRPLRRTLRRAYDGLVRPPCVVIGLLKWMWRGTRFGSRFEDIHPSAAAEVSHAASTPNPLRCYAESITTGPGLWKWQHYLDIYDRHFAKFVGKPVNILEIGVYSGGSLNMWRAYFGDRCRVFGVDIEPACRIYEREGITILIGDQADRGFWQRVRAEIPPLDVIVDDGGHLVHQQVTTLEEMLAHLRPGGIYLCEDIHGCENHFHFYVCALAQQLHANRTETNPDDPSRAIVIHPSPFQRAIRSVHIYPFVVVIERTNEAVAEFVAPKRGTEWQPFGEAWIRRSSRTAADGVPTSDPMS